VSTTPVHPVARDHCLAPERVDSEVYAGRYRRLLDLPPLEVDEESLHALGRPGGPCDVGVEFVDDAEDADARTAAVWPFFGQFVAHDITADRSPLGHRSDPSRIRNFRTPRANLEGVYGAGPVGSPYLYERDDPARLLLGPGGHDVPRNHQGIALVGDPRNDVHLFVSQLQVAFIRLHNILVERLREDGEDEATVFEEARRSATWHYQHVLLREFLPLTIGDSLTAELLDGGSRLYQPGDEPWIPFEFADAAYRAGHSQIRQRYQVNPGFGPVPVFPDLMGFGPVAADRTVDWSLQIDVPGRPPAQRSKPIDGRLPSSLIALPVAISGAAEGTDYASLANRDLQRGLAVGLPSGEAVARALGVEPLTPDQVGLAEHGWQGETPLWLYLLKEAEVLGDGDRMGPVGGRIVGEVLVGIVDADAESFRRVDPGWTPTLPSHEPGRFGLADILAPTAGIRTLVT
jgi:hypothetical protein